MKPVYRREATGPAGKFCLIFTNHWMVKVHLFLESQNPQYQTFTESVKYQFHFKLLCLSLEFKACFSFRWNIATTLPWQLLSDSLMHWMQQTNVPQAKHISVIAKFIMGIKEMVKFCHPFYCEGKIVFFTVRLTVTITQFLKCWPNFFI